MGTCFSKKSTTAVPPQAKVKPNPDQPAKTKNAAIVVAEQQVPKKEIFVIKHRISHEIDRHPDQDNLKSFDNNKNPNTTTDISQSMSNGGATVTTSSCTKEELDAILIQCGRLSRSNSTGAQNPKHRRRISGSKRSFDFDLEVSSKNDDGDEGDSNRHRQREHRVSSPCSRRSSREREERGRRVSISPNRRSQSPFANLNSSSSNRPVKMKMVSVPATDKSNNGGVVKRVHVKRNVSRSRSPARPKLVILSDDQSQEEQRHQSYSNRRNPLADVDNNAAGSEQPCNQKPNKKHVEVEEAIGVKKITRSRSFRLSRDVNTNPPSYASLLLEDIQNFHQNNATTTTGEAFSVPECVSKARLIMEAVADLNNSSSSMESTLHKYVTVRRRAVSAATDSTNWASSSSSSSQQRDLQVDYRTIALS